MSSPKWKLGRGKSYPVELAAGSSTLQAEVAASGNAVSLPVKDERFVKALRVADALDSRRGRDIKVALDKSAAGLDRLEACYAKNGSATETTLSWRRRASRRAEWTVSASGGCAAC